jgi:hypothetical protein
MGRSDRGKGAGLLTDQTSFGTLSVTLVEPGATVASPPIDDN